MQKAGKEFFTNNKVLMVGYSSKPDSFSRMVYRAFVNGGVNVTPYNPNANGKYDIRVYNSLKDIPSMPETAYVLLNSEKSAAVVSQLAAAGVKKVLFQSKSTVTPAALEECRKLGMDARVGCPMMVFGGFIHKVHAFFAGGF